jgi:hypothetical protein
MDGIVPLTATLWSSQEAVQLAALQDAWQPPPSRDAQPIASVTGVDPMWAGCDVALTACVIRYGHRQKKALDHLVLVPTAQRLPGPWRVRHYEERPEMEQDYQQMKRGGWQRTKLSSTRYREIVFYILTVALSYSLYHLFAHTRAGARFADTTRQARAFEQLRSRRTHIMA